MSSEILTVKEAAAMLKLSPETVKRKARAGELPAAKAGRQWRFRRVELDRWLARGGDLYERAVDEALAEEAARVLSDPDEKWVPWEQVKAERGL